MPLGSGSSQKMRGTPSDTTRLKKDIKKNTEKAERDINIAEEKGYPNRSERLAESRDYLNLAKAQTDSLNKERKKKP